VATPKARPTAFVRAGGRAAAVAGAPLAPGGDCDASGGVGGGVGGCDGESSAVLVACVAVAAPEAKPTAFGRAGCCVAAAAGAPLVPGGDCDASGGVGGCVGGCDGASSAVLAACVAVATPKAKLAARRQRRLTCDGGARRPRAERATRATGRAALR